MMDYDSLSTVYARHRRLHPRVMSRLLSRVSGLGARVLLDVGCGPGTYIAALEEATGRRCIGVDPSERMLRLARERSARVAFSRGAAESLGFGDASVDLAFSVDVIHHVRDRDAGFREIHRVLRRAGSVCTVTDSEKTIRERRPLAAYFPEIIDVELSRYPSIATLRDEMEDAGLRVTEEEEVEWSRPVLAIDAYRDKAFSSLHLITDEAFRRGIERMEEDLRRGPIPNVSRYVMLWGRRG
jgi:ubiquinone/menaquinone biosynthesis C-methylase UbiE